MSQRKVEGERFIVSPQAICGNDAKYTFALVSRIFLQSQELDSMGYSPEKITAKQYESRAIE